MARIPVGNFGNAVAERPPLDRRLPLEAFGIDNGMPAVGDALSKLAGDALAEEKRLQREQEAEAKAAAKEATRVKSITAQAQAKVSLGDLHDDLVKGLDDGRYDKGALLDLQQERAGKLIEDAVKGVSPEHQELVRASLLDDVGRSRRDLSRVVDARNRQDIAAGISGYMETMQRYAQRGEAQRQEAMNNVATVLQSTGPKAGMKADDIAKTVQGFRENVTLTWLDGAISKNQTNAKALARIAKDIAEDKFPELDPGKRNFLEAKIQRNQQHLMHQAEVAERRNLANLERMERRMERYVENGMDIPADEMTQFERASKGTAFEGAWRAIVAEQRAVAELLRLSPAQMDARIKQVEASYGKTPSLEQAAHVAKLKRFADNSAKLLDESPLDFAVARSGAVVEPLDFGNTASWESNLAARATVLKEQEQRTGAAPKGLFPREAQALAGVLRSSEPGQQREILASLRRGFGDMDVFKATMQQIAPDNPVVANAGIFAARGLESTKDRAVADLILKGNALLRQDTKADGKPAAGKLIPMPKDEELRRAFANYEGNAYAGKEQTRNVAYQTALAIYAAKASEEGDFSGSLVSRRWAEAMRLATGRIESYRGRHIVMPYGMDMGTFKDGLDSRAAALVRSGRLDPSITLNTLRDMPLENAGDGRYVFRSGDGALVGKDGRPVIVDFNEATR